MMERRKSKRCSILQFMDVTLLKEEELLVEAVNIGEGGMLCRSKTPIQPLSPVYLMVRLPGVSDDYILKVEGSVMHVKESSEGWVFGVAFGPMTPEDRQALTAFLSSCAE